MSLSRRVATTVLWIKYLNSFITEFDATILIVQIRINFGLESHLYEKFIFVF